MKKKTAFVMALILLGFSTAGVSEKKSTALDENVSIVFPGKPVLKGEENNRQYLLQNPGIFYSVSRIVNTEEKNEKKSFPHYLGYYRGYAKSYVGSSGAKMLNSKAIMVNNNAAYYFAYSVSFEGKTLIGEMFLLLIGNVRYKVECIYPPDNGENIKKEKAAFYNSITIRDNIQGIDAKKAESFLESVYGSPKK